MTYSILFIFRPHYYEWQRRNNGCEAPRIDVNNHVCGQELDARVIRTINTNLLTKNTDNLRQDIENVYLSIMQMGRFRVNQVENYIELRVDYLDGVIMEEDFTVKVQRANKQHEKRREIGENLALFIT